MTKKIDRLEDYIPASKAADILSKKLKRRISPRYIYKLKGVRFQTMNATSKLYYRPDIEAVTIRERRKHK